MTNGPRPGTPAPKPATPKPIEIIELVDVTSTTKLLAMLALGLAVGVAVYYIATHVMIEDDANA